MNAQDTHLPVYTLNYCHNCGKEHSLCLHWGKGCRLCCEGGLG